MTDNEIFKSLEWWITAVHNVGSITISKEEMLAVNDLINRQKAEISVLRKLLDKAETEMNNQSENIKKLVAGHRNLQKDFDSANEELFFRRLENCELADKIEKAEDEAIKEFAERLKEQYEIWDDDEYYFNYVTTDQIDNLVKEMVGDAV